jgi:hypothetical protein
MIGKYLKMSSNNLLDSCNKYFNILDKYRGDYLSIVEMEFILACLPVHMKKSKELFYSQNRKRVHKKVFKAFLMGNLLITLLEVQMCLYVNGHISDIPDF